MADLLGVGQLHYGSIWYRLAATHGRGQLAMPANGSSFRSNFFDHVTKLMVWGHNGDMGQRQCWCWDIFLFSLEIYIVVDII